MNQDATTEYLKEGFESSHHKEALQLAQVLPPIPAR